MSDTMNTRRTRRQLLIGASVMALMGSMGIANASDADNPPLWIELGWHNERFSNPDEIFAPAFTTSQPRPDFETISPLSAQDNVLYGFGGEGSVSFQPNSSGWMFSAAVKYGKAQHHKQVRQTEPPVPYLLQTLIGGNFLPLTPTIPLYAASKADSSESHAILDFQIGKDVGIGLFGNAKSTISAGVRFAQISSTSNVSIGGVPDFYHGTNKYVGHHHHHYAAMEGSNRNFHGVGPELSWNVSAPLAGAVQDGQIALDWGVNAGMLFGRQKARVHHHTTAQYTKWTLKYAINYSTVNLVDHNSANLSRSKSVIVPNLGGFAGLSFRYSDAKLSLGYRADFFFGAMDSGIDTAKKDNIGFYGPFATISIGLGG